MARNKYKTVPFGDLPNNCNVIEFTGDGKPIGRCELYLNYGTCPIHGKSKESEENPYKNISGSFNEKISQAIDIYIKELDKKDKKD